MEAEAGTPNGLLLYVSVILDTYHRGSPFMLYPVGGSVVTQRKHISLIIPLSVSSLNVSDKYNPSNPCNDIS